MYTVYERIEGIVVYYKCYDKSLEEMLQEAM
jgi:hypothetical protein